MKLFLIDIDRKRLLPLTFSRPACDLLIGIDTIRDKWESALNLDVVPLTASYLAFGEYNDSDAMLIHGSAIPTRDLAIAIHELEDDEMITHRGRLIAVKASSDEVKEVQAKIDRGEAISFTQFDRKETTYDHELTVIEKPSDIFAHNGKVLRSDFERLTKNYHTTDFTRDISVKGDEIYIEDGAKLSNCVLNASDGPIYIGRDAEIMEGALIRGPLSLGANSTIKMGAKIYGDTSIGWHCKVGGEVGNSVINDFSNKGHDGYLGNSVIGSWCNLGADTNTSNLMNTYGEVKVWDYSREAIVPTGRQFHGLIMGDHSKSGINTMFNTGTVVGMCANIFGGGFPDKFIPSFSWGSPEKGFTEFRMDKAEEAAAAMMARRGIKLSKRDKDVFAHVAEHDRKYRK
jgi:UDP-N-acetylglucosamine diphosphorylase/glucosamine-1-phosphate N-acetyltransferase